MSELPATWAETPLDEVCVKITDGTHHSPANSDQGEYKYITAKNIRKHGLDLSKITYVAADVHAEIFARCAPELGDVLYIKDGATTGIAVNNPLDEPFSMLSSVALLKPDRDALDEKFLCRWLNSPDAFASMTGQMGGSAIRRLTLKKIGSSPLPIPPLPEQRRIVAKLDRLSARSAAARDHLARTTKLATRAKQAILAAAFDPEKNPAWEKSTVEQVLAQGLIGLVRSKTQQCDRGTPYIRMNHYDLNGRWNDKDLTYVNVSAQEFERYELRPQDLLFNTRNSAELVGKAALWPQDRPGHVFNNNLLRMRFKKNVDPAFAYFYMISPVFREFLETVKNATTSVAAIYQKSLMRGPFPLPEIEEQKAIVHRIKAAFARIDRLTEEASRAAHLLDRLDERLLAKAFRGELVPQDPEDEPAEALLARIREARAKSPKTKRKRRA